MFYSFFINLKDAQIPVSIGEYLTLLEALDRNIIDDNVESFYYFARTALVKDESNLDKFDRVFSHTFRGLETLDAFLKQDTQAIPEDWLRKLAEKHLYPEEMAEIEALGGFDNLMETLKKRLQEQEKRHQGGNKMIGTAGTSPFGAHGYNPEGVRISSSSRHKRAVKVWDARQFKNLDGAREIDTRNIKLALRRLRKFAREGALEEFDLNNTITNTARQGYLDIKMRAERRNAIKVLTFFDIGGSMDAHVKQAESLFSAALSEFKRMESFYFHNCVYENVWKNNLRHTRELVPSWDILRTYATDHRVIFVGDAAMSPYEIAMRGGSVEHWNEEAGAVWLQRFVDIYPHLIWLNPSPKNYWQYTQSTAMIKSIIGEERMFELTLEGLDGAMKVLSR